MEITASSILADHLIPWLIRVGLALLILYVGRLIVRWLCRILSSQLKKQGLDDMLVKLASKTAYIALLGLVILAALEQIGIDTTSALAVFGAAGLALGLAVKDSLSNFAAGVMIAFFQPFKLNHYIEAAGTAGTVQEVGMFNTTLLTPDNKRVVVPNRLVYNDTIVNYSAEDTRRVDRCKNDDYWGVYFSVIEKIKQTFDLNGISIPYPQRDVHMIQTDNKTALIYSAL
ncbi:MAG: mechanosensitive ion channel [Gammaproteobacteria bacterium]